MDFALPLYAVQRLAVRTLIGDPILPAVDVVAVLDEPTSATPRRAWPARPLAGAQVRSLPRLRDARTKWP
jgi:hypothetical protein